MGRRQLNFSLDLDKLIGLGRRAPALASKIPERLREYLPMVAGLADMADQFLDETETTGFDDPRLPDTGPLGKGRQAYLRSRDSYTDAHVAQAVRRLMQIEPEAIIQIGKTLDFILALTTEGAAIIGSVQPTDTELRGALDKLLSSDTGLGVATVDKFGDMVYLDLRTNKPKLGTKKDV